MDNIKEAAFNCQVNEYRISQQNLDKNILLLKTDIDSIYLKTQVLKGINAIRRKLFKLEQSTRNL